MGNYYSSQKSECWVRGTRIKQNTKASSKLNYKTASIGRFAHIGMHGAVVRSVKYALICLAEDMEGHLSKSSLSCAQHKLTNLHVLE